MRGFNIFLDCSDQSHSTPSHYEEALKLFSQINKENSAEKECKIILHCDEVLCELSLLRRIFELTFIDCKLITPLSSISILASVHKFSSSILGPLDLRSAKLPHCFLLDWNLILPVMNPEFYCRQLLCWVILHNVHHNDLERKFYHC